MASVREEGGRVIARGILPTEEEALVEFFRGMRGAIQVAFEEGTQAQWLHDLLLLVAIGWWCAAGEASRCRAARGKGDADELSKRLRLGGLKGVYHGSPHRAQLKELAHTYEQVVADATRVMQRLKALFRARGIMRTPWRVGAPGDGAARAPPNSERPIERGCGTKLQEVPNSLFARHSVNATTAAVRMPEPEMAGSATPSRNRRRAAPCRSTSG